MNNWMNLPNNIHYSNVSPLITGRHECVGVIYNHQELTSVGNGVGRNNQNNNYLLPRTPYWLTFTYNNNLSI